MSQVRPSRKETARASDYNGSSAVWENIITPGAYTVVETDPSAEWTVVGNNVQVNVPTSGSAQTTITNNLNVQTATWK